MFRGGSFINKDEILFRIADREIKDLLTEAAHLRWRYVSAFTLTHGDDMLLDFARDLEGAAISIAADCAGRKLITWDDYKVIRNTIDFIGTDVSMEERLS